MDEVDFTILSATSVLGDLIEKCPPAEACRDAFDRMSKATVQMCMSTTGFSSSSAQGLTARDKTNDYFGPPSTTQFATSNARSSRPTKTAAPRPPPTFDMGLNDLFPAPSPGPSPGATGTAPMYPPHMNSGSRHMVKHEHSNEAYDKHRQQNTSPGNYSSAASPTNRSATDNAAIDPSLLPSPHSENTHNSQNMQTYTSALTASNISQNDMYGTNYEHFDFSNIDFMQGGNPNIANGPIDGGFDMGFGLGWDGQDHDFSEGGGQLDLFEGFFFGGNGGV